MVEAPGMGAEKLDVAVYTIRALDDLVEMAKSKGDTATLSWAKSKSDELKAKFDHDWWDPGQRLFADSLCFNQVLAHRSHSRHLSTGRNATGATLLDQRHPDGDQYSPGRPSQRCVSKTGEFESSPARPAFISKGRTCRPASPGVGKLPR